ncbi:MAG: hypothetical protein WD001_00515, partial [Woeseia sp.]
LLDTLSGASIQCPALPNGHVADVPYAIGRCRFENLIFQAFAAAASPAGRSTMNRAGGHLRAQARFLDFHSVIDREE